MTGNPEVALIIVAFVAISLLMKFLHERLVFFFHSNFWYIFLDFLSDYVYYGRDIGINASLSLDSPSEDVLKRRWEGQEYLSSKLNKGAGAGTGTGSDGNGSKNEKKGSSRSSIPSHMFQKEYHSLSNKRGQALAGHMVDCRFTLSQRLMPLLRELEFPSDSFVCEVCNRRQKDEQEQQQHVHHSDGGSEFSASCSAGGIHEVVLEDKKQLLFIGSDAVHTLGVESFYMPLQEEINRRMTLHTTKTNTTTACDQIVGGGDTTTVKKSIPSSSMLRFAPILLNPELERNVNLILGITGMDQVRYCLSGSEAMDAAFKDVRATGREGGKSYIVRFISAYHGHTSGVNFFDNSQNTIYLKECDPSSLDFIERYHYRIAGVVMNPMQHFTGINKHSPPGEKLTFGTRQRTPTSREEYAKWLHSLQAKCNYCTRYLTRIAFIVDDVYFAFRTPELFSSQYFIHPETGAPLRPDVLVLGKGVAAGYPLSMVLGRHGYLNTYDKKYILRVNKTVGTMSAWYGGLTASNVFLEAITSKNPQTSTSLIVKVPAGAQISELVSKFDAFTAKLNRLFEIAKTKHGQQQQKIDNSYSVQNNKKKRRDTRGLPLRIINFSNTFSINYLSNSLYNSRYTQYLLAEGVFLGNDSTGKFNLNADATHADLDLLADKFVAAASKMHDHGYFEPYRTDLLSKAQLMLPVALRFVINILRLLYDRVMEDKRIDIHVSHNHPVNKFGHFWSSILIIFFAFPCMLLGKSLESFTLFFVAELVRQSGHFFYERQDTDIEKRKVGHKNTTKKHAVAGVVLAAVVYRCRAVIRTHLHHFLPGMTPQLTLGQYLWLVVLSTIVPHFVEIAHQFGVIRGILWIFKIITDPFTDLVDFYEYWIIHPKWFLEFKDHRAVYKLDLASKEIRIIH